MEWVRERIRLAVPLLAAAYLGFFAFGLVMGVMGPFEVAWMTALAGICVIGLIAYVIAGHLGIHPVHAGRPLARTQQTERERRGW